MKRAQIWLKAETKAMLNLIKEENLLKHSLSDAELVEVLAKLMIQKGYDRSPLQIRMKLKALEKSYFSLKRKSFDPSVLRQFTHFDILNELYSRKRKKDNDESDGGMLSDYNDDNSNIWLAEEIQKMLSLIEDGELTEELSNGFTLYALKIISEELSKAGFNKDVDQVETALASLKMTYIKTEEALKNNVDTEVCPYFDYLQKIWGPKTATEPMMNRNHDNLVDLTEDIEMDDTLIPEEKLKVENTVTNKVNGHLNSSIVNRSQNKCSKWSEEETLGLLSVIEETDVFNEFIYNLSTTTARKLMNPFFLRGYRKSIDDVTDKLRSLRDTYLKSILNGPKLNANCQYMNKIDNMIVVKKVDIDRALQTMNKEGKNMFVPGQVVKKSEHNYVVEKHSKVKQEPVWEPIESITENDDDQFEPYESDVNIIEIKRKNVNVKDNSKNIKKRAATAPPPRNAYLVATSTPLPAKKPNITEDNKDIIIKQEPFNDQSGEFMKMVSTPLPSKLIKFINRDPGIIVERISSLQPPGLVPIPPVSNSLNLSVNCTSNAAGTKSTEKGKITTKAKAKQQTSPTMSKPIMLQNTPPISTSESSTKLLGSNYMILNSETPKPTLDLIFKHEEEMQIKHHRWLERQFELQRKYDRDQRAILLNELRELKKMFTQIGSKNNILSNLTS